METRVESTERSVENQKTKALIKKSNIFSWVFVFTATLVYSVVWSYIGIIKLLSLNSYVFDLGINSERGWLILHTNLGLHGYLTTVLNSGIVFPLSPLTATGNFFAMIIFQAFLIASVGPLIYLIAREKGLKPRESSLITFAYFLYFPVYGIMWFDFHYQVFFMPLFLFAYLLYIRKNYVSSAFLFLLAGTVRYPYSIFPMAFAFIELILILRNKRSAYDRRRFALMSLLFLITAIWTLSGFLIFGVSSTIPHSGMSPYTITGSAPWLRVYVILLFLAPLLFLPVLRVRWIILVLPAFFLFITSSYTWYSYPHVFQGQYVAGVVPFLFLGLIDYFASSGKINHEDKRVRHNPLKAFRKITNLSLITSVIVFLIFLNIFFAPFSPLNDQFGDQFNFQQNTSYNPHQYSELSSMIGMIPSSETYVLYQNNIPEVFPRSLPQGGALLMGGYLGSLGNVSVQEAINNSWSVYSGSVLVSMPINYALADAANPNFYLRGNSVYSIVHDMYSSGKYGILSEGYGLMLLEHGYKGPIQNYVPENSTIAGIYFSKNIASLYYGNGSNVSSVSGTFENYSGPALYMMPGHYNITFFINIAQSLNSTSDWPVDLSIYSGNNVLYSVKENLSAAFLNASTLTLSLTASIKGIEGNVWYSLFTPGKELNISISKVVITQQTAFQTYESM